MLRKTVTRSIKNPDGSSRPYRTIVARNLHCMTVNHDDMSWKEADIKGLEEAAAERGMCLHLSSRQIQPGNAGGFGPGIFEMQGGEAVIHLGDVNFGGMGMAGVMMGGRAGGPGGIDIDINVLPHPNPQPLPVVPASTPTPAPVAVPVPAPTPTPVPVAAPVAAPASTPAVISPTGIPPLFVSDFTPPATPAPAPPFGSLFAYGDFAGLNFGSRR